MLRCEVSIMKIEYLNNNLSLLTKKKIYIYGAGTYGIKVKEWIIGKGFSDVYFCVDKEYAYNSISSVIIDTCIDELRTQRAIIVYSMGENDALNKLEMMGINKVYSVYNPYNFWEYTKISSEQIEKTMLEIKGLYDDELSICTCEDYIESIKDNNGKKEEKNVVNYQMYFNELTNNIGEGLYIDVGAYVGDTVERFKQFYDTSDHEIIALEPDDDSFNVLLSKYKNDSSVCCLKYGAWNENKKIGFKIGQGQRSEVSQESDNYIDVKKIDDIVIDRKVAYIKIGNDYALEILEGAKGVIERDFPIVAIVAVYHFELLYRIPRFFKELSKTGKTYNVFLRHHSKVSCGLLFIYAIPEKEVDN